MKLSIRDRRDERTQGKSIRHDKSHDQNSSNRGQGEMLTVKRGMFMKLLLALILLKVFIGSSEAFNFSYNEEHGFSFRYPASWTVNWTLDMLRSPSSNAFMMMTYHIPRWERRWGGVNESNARRHLVNTWTRIGIISSETIQFQGRRCVVITFQTYIEGERFTIREHFFDYDRRGYTFSFAARGRYFQYYQGDFRYIWNSLKLHRADYNRR